MVARGSSPSAWPPHAPIVAYIGEEGAADRRYGVHAPNPTMHMMVRVNKNEDKPPTCHTSPAGSWSGYSAVGVGAGAGVGCGSRRTQGSRQEPRIHTWLLACLLAGPRLHTRGMPLPLRWTSLALHHNFWNTDTSFPPPSLLLRPQRSLAPPRPYPRIYIRTPYPSLKRSIAPPAVPSPSLSTPTFRSFLPSAHDTATART